jgi:NAD+ kinase
VPKVGIIYNDSKPVACRTTQQLRQQFTAVGWEVLAIDGQGGMLGHRSRDILQLDQGPVSDGQAAQGYRAMADLTPPGFDEQMKFVIVLGGDGTVLSACRLVAPMGIPILAVNTGHMGFITETYLSGLSGAIEALLAEEFEVEERTTLAVRVFKGDRCYWEALCLNEMVLHREPLTSMCHFEVQIGRHAPVDMAADGVIVATPTGSTAYALSTGGPVITPDVPALQLVPICPHSLASRALVFSETERVTIRPITPHPMVMVVDGNAGCAILLDNRVQVERSPYNARFIRLQPPEFFRLLREKLGWGLPHIAKPTSVELP